LLLTLLFSAPVWSAEFTVDLLPGQIFSTLDAAENAMHGANVPASSYLQFKEIISQTATETVRRYNVPDRPPTIWWRANIGNTGPGPLGGTLDPGGNCESCLQASGGFHWTGVLTPISDSPSFPFSVFKGCQFTQRGGTIQNNGCVVIQSPACDPGFSLATTPVFGEYVCVNPFMAMITEMGGCPVGALPDFPPAGDLCSASLEAGRGKDVNNACPASSVMSDPNGEPCLAQKLGALGIPYAGPTATIRTSAYQQHLKDVWDKYWEHQWLITDPALYQACTAKRSIVEAEMNKHGIDYAPARIDSTHLDGTAFDISRATVNRIADVPALLRAVPACNLKWGGRFPVPDEVHFFTPPPAPAP